MKRLLLEGIVLSALILAGRCATAAELSLKASPLIPAWSWTGFYVGSHIGSAMALDNVADPLGSSIFGDQIHSPGFFGGGQIGYNWQAPNSHWVFGLEADASYANLDGTNTCYAFSGTFNSINCRAHTDTFGTLTGRIGRTFGPLDRTLAYLKGGLAWGHGNVDMILNNSLLEVTGATSTRFASVGWTIGVGAEYAMTAHWLVRAEYDYLNLGNPNVTAPSPSNTTNAVPDVPPATGSLVAVPGTSVSQQIHAFKLALNYKFGPDSTPFPDGFAWPRAAAASPLPVKAGAKPISATPGWEVEMGARYWYSSGRFQKDIAPGNIGAQNPTLNISRLTWDDLTAHSGEAFGRVDTPWNVFVKGFIGGGRIPSGKINDEDWGISSGDGAPGSGIWTGYSNTVGNASGKLAYASIDGGYNVFRGPEYKVGAFIGYNYYRDDKSSFTCSQIALPASGICNPPENVFILGENDRWQSLRVGANAEVMLTSRLKLVADVAYLPYVKFTGQDLHPLRPFVADEWGTGIGTQVEMFLHYYVTPQFSVGAGGRYWAMWTTSGADCRLPPNGDCPAPLQNMQYKTERFGLLFQAAYKWHQTTGAAMDD